MPVMIFFTILAVVALAASMLATLPRLARIALIVMSPCLFVIGAIVGSSVVAPADQTGVVSRLFGTALPPGDIVARHGEQGPQAEILGPGWHFGYFPFIYSVELAP